MPTFHVHLDEAGDFNFSPKGSSYYVFAAAWTYEPQLLATELNNLRFRLLGEGNNLDSFHATEDKQRHRNMVVDLLLEDSAWKFGAVVIEKAKVNPSLRDQVRFYSSFAMTMLKFVLRGRVTSGTDRVLVYTDRLPMQRNKSAVAKALRTACRRELDRSITFHLYHHPRQSNAWLQVVDYCCWAVYRKWDSGDARTYDTLEPRLAARELEVIKHGTTSYY